MKPIIFTLVLLYTLVANAGDVERIYSITSRTNGSRPAGFFFKNKLFVFADDGIHGSQLWECDSANTLHPISSILKNPIPTTMELNNKIFFFCGSPQTNYGLWEFNGIDEPQPRLLISKLSNISDIMYQVFSNKIYTYVFGDGLQEFDGINPPKKIANRSSHFHSQYLPTLTVYKNRLYFISTDNVHGNELWSCDSTGAAVMVADINPGENSSDPRTPQVHKDKLYFWADDGIHGIELWEYDGTQEPRMVADINSGSDASWSYYEPNLMEFNDKLYFTAYDVIHDGSLWEYDDPHPPRMITGTESSFPSKKFIFKNKLYYYSPSYLCEYDGINNPKHLLYSYNWDKPAIFENNLYVWVPQGNNREDLYKYDGINPPENLTASLISGANYIDPDFIIVNNRLCFGQCNRLYTCAGDGVHLISDNFPLRFNRIGEFNHLYYFQFEDPLYGSELRSMDGIHPPVMLTDLNKTLIVPEDLRLKVLNRKLYFTFTDSVNKYVEYDSIRFETLSPDFNPSSVYNLLSYNNKFYYNRGTGKLSVGLFENNGIEEHEISSSSSNAGLIVFNKAIYYGINTTGFYKYDGENPPERISELDGEYLMYQTVFNDRLLLFTGYDSMTFREYDGLNPPKILGRGLNYDLSSIVSHQFTQMNHKFYFTGYEREHGKEPWVYDGSNPPAILADITEGSNSSAPLYFTAFGNKLYFSAQDEIHGREIWVYDGINPPELLLDIEKGSGSSSPEQLMVSNDKLYFKAFTKAFGTELWQYDGINEPRMVSDLYRGPAGSDPNDLVVYKGQLYLSAVTKEEGRQLYRFCESCSNTVVSACDSYNFNGTSLYSSGRYYDTIPGSMGQDSIIRLDLTILKSSALVIDTAACERYVFAGSTLTESGIFYTTVPNSAGCDSLITLHLTIHPSTSSELEAVGCESYVAPGGRYVWKESGTYVDTIPNAAGCDSIITIHLTVNHLNTAVISSGSGLQAVSSGGEYQWVNCLENYLPITGAVDQSFTPLSPGTYAVIMKDQVCTDTSDCYTVIATDIRDIESKQGMTVYPNPTSGAFTIDLGKVYPEALITIIRYDGEVIRIERMLNSRIVDLNPYASPGIYTVNIIADKKEVNLKVIRQ